MAANSVSPFILSHMRDRIMGHAGTRTRLVVDIYSIPYNTTQVRVAYEYVPRPLAHIGVEARTPHQLHLPF